MFGNKKYKKGMEDAAKAYKAFGEKQEAALKYILNEVREGKSTLEEALKKLGDIDANIGDLYSYLKSKEKAELYTIYTPYDIANLGKEEKLFLGGALLRLTMDKMPTEEQQAFMRSILHYLDIKEPPFGIELSAIEDIYGISAQAIYQVILEYLILQNGDNYDETELQQKFLESFQLNPKSKAAIANHVETLYIATGAEGLVEKYGYKVEGEENTGNEKKDTAEDEKKVEKEAAKIVLNSDFYNLNYNRVVLKDYICFKEYNSQEIVIDKKKGVKEEINWLPSISFSNSYVSHKNLCCAKSQSNDKIYFIDFDEKRYRQLKINYNHSSNELIAMNDEWLIINSSTINEIILHDLNSDTYETLNGHCNSAYFEGNIIYFIYFNEVFKYDLDMKHFSKILDVYKMDNEDFYHIEDSQIYNGKLYLVGQKKNSNSVWGLSEYHLYSIHLDNLAQYEKIVDAIYVYDGPNFHTKLSKFDGGWVFVSEDIKITISPKFFLTVFSCEGNNIVKIARGCGEQREIKTGLFNTKTEDIRKATRNFKWGNYVFFEQNDSGCGTIVACVNINEPMNIIYGT